MHWSADAYIVLVNHLLAHCVAAGVQWITIKTALQES